MDALGASHWLVCLHHPGLPEDQAHFRFRVWGVVEGGRFWVSFTWGWGGGGIFRLRRRVLLNKQCEV